MSGLPVWKTRSTRSVLRAAALLLFFAAASGYVLYPRSVELHGKLHAGPDPLAILWAVSWNHHQLLSDPLHLFRANIFYPAQHALAHSDSMIVPSLLVLPFKPLFPDPVVLFNIAYWVAFALSGVFMYVLARRLTGNWFIATLAGVFYAFNPYRLDTVSHLQYASAQWLPLVVLATLLFFLEKRPLHAYSAALFTWATALTCGTHFLMLTVPGAFLAGLLWLASPPGRRQVWHLGWSGLLFALMLAPFALQMMAGRAEYGDVIGLNDVVRFSSDVLDYARRPRYMTGAWYHLMPERIKTPYFSPFPGFTLSALILLALASLLAGAQRQAGRPSTRLQAWLAWTRGGLALLFAGVLAAIVWAVVNPPDEPVRRVSVYTVLMWLLVGLPGLYAALSAAAYRRQMIDAPALLLPIFVFLSLTAAVLSFGPYVHVNNRMVGQGVHWVLFTHVPGFTAFRQLFHYNAVFQLFIIPAVAIVLTRLERLPKGLYVAACAGLAALVFADYRTDMRPNYEPVPTRKDLPAVYEWLAAEPDPSPVLELPMYKYPYHPETSREYWSIYHWKPLVNGNFSYPPLGYKEFVDAVADFPSPGALEAIQQRIQVKYVIVGLDRYPAAAHARIEALFAGESSTYELVRRFPGYLVFRNTGWSDSLFYATSWVRPGSP